jgi:hypothetical protein
MKTTLPKVPFRVPGSPRSGMQNGHEYVWHCHILEHEEHDMMRPLIVISWQVFVLISNNADLITKMIL